MLTYEQKFMGSDEDNVSDKEIMRWAAETYTVPNNNDSKFIQRLKRGVIHRDWHQNDPTNTQNSLVSRANLSHEPIPTIQLED